MIDLTFLDAPHETGRKRFQVFADRGFKGPYRKWLELDRDVFYKTMDKFDIPLTEVTFHLADETMAYLVNFINS